MANLNRLAAQAALRVLRRLLAGVEPGGRAYLGRMVMRDRGDPASLALADFCLNALNAWKNRQYDIQLNGEQALLQRLAPFHPRIVLDVGANVGDWTKAACQHLPEATVHAFEIAPAIADVLRRTVGADARVVINAVGLGEHAGQITIYASPESSTATSTLRHAIETSAAEHGIRTIEEISAKIVTGDSYLAEHGLEHVDVLKIDVEGAEFSVLRSFSDAFARGAIDLVQFEYGKINLVTRDFLADFYKFFADRGYVVGKLFPEGVAFKSYEVEDEDFIGPNFIACRTARSDIIAALRCPPLRLA